MTGLDWLIAVYGLAAIIAIGRGLQAYVNRAVLWRAAFWCTSAMGLGLYIELLTPAAATFDNVMVSFILAWAAVF